MRVLVIGDSMVDVSMSGLIERISPEAPVPVFLKKQEVISLGGAGNVAASLSSFGLDVTLLTLVGKDNSGSHLERLSADTGIRLQAMYDPQHITSTKTRFWCSNQQVFRADQERRLTCNMAFRNFVDEHLRSQTAYDSIVISDYNKGTLDAGLIADLVNYSIQNKCYLVCDPKGLSVESYAKVTVITPNLREAARLLNQNSFAFDNHIIRSTLIQFRHFYSIENPVITAGDIGIYYLDAENNLILQNSIKAHLADPTGAGDTAIAAITYGLCMGESFESCVALACAAASFTVTHVGTSPCPLAEMQSRLETIAKPTKILSSVK